MFSYSQPHSAYSYMIRSKESVNLLTDAAQKGIALLGKQIDYQLLLAYQNYVTSIINIVSSNMGKNYLYSYNQLNLYISKFTPYEQVKQTIEFLLQFAKEL